jgi:hypothetical protein
LGIPEDLGIAAHAPTKRTLVLFVYLLHCRQDTARQNGKTADHRSVIGGSDGGRIQI